ncbi:hypothetical protein HanRHA438_Chr06g0261611 [Helianthus annuus]|nr:hypothetical protein HanRHA438_Chr06g0261611 [Helianthus annuus]
MVCLLWEMMIIRRQMRDEVMSMCHSKRIWYNLAIIRCKSSIADSWHAKGCNLDVL